MSPRSSIVAFAVAQLLSGAAFAQSAPTLTRDNGAPVGDNQNSQTAGAAGPALLQDVHLIQKLQRFDRERIPERVVHARGTGAYGDFVV
ncbi:MAG: catalase, partial [Lysobacter sp.]